MKKTKMILASVLSVCCLFGTVGVAGCGSKVANDESTLEIYIGNFGYGTKWLDEAIKLFKEQDWVKEKYPNLDIPTPSSNSNREFTANKIASEANANTTDLFFSTVSASGRYATKASDGSPLFEDLTEVYNSTVPNENITLKDKMLPDIYASQDVEVDGKTVYYAMPWVNGYEGLLYNKTLMDRLYGGESYVMPRTTDELLALAEKIRVQDTTRSVFVSSSKYAYWMSAIMIWWGQYEGLTNYENYWNGVNEANQRIAADVIGQKGRLRSLEVAESLIGRKTVGGTEITYIHSDTNVMEFTQAQSKFLAGESYIMQNGDWFENEMRETAAENPNNYDLRFMRTPVISSIVEKCKTVKTDSDLAAVVDCIDNGMDYETTKAAYTSGELSQADYKRIKEARTLMYRVVGHEAYIPAYATAKEVAKDFLRFLATDIAIESFVNVTNGVSTPFAYDLQTKNPSFYESLSEIHKTRLEIAKTGVSLTPYTSFKLYYLGGHYTFVKNSNVEALFTSKNPKDRKTARQIYQDDIDYYTDAVWNTMLQKAGLL